MCCDLQSRLMAYHDSLGNEASRALIKDAMAENSRAAFVASALLEAAKALIDRDCSYEGRNLVIPCASHGAAIRLANDLRAAILQAERI